MPGRLKEKAGELGVAESVIFCGPASRVERLLWAMDVFAFPSRFEGLGIAAVEAQAAGTPVAASELVPDEACAGPIFRRLSLDAGAYAWADALLGACRPADRASCADRVKEAGFDISGVARQLEGCFVSGEMQ